MPLLSAAETTTSTTEATEVPRIVGDPLPLWIWWAAGIALLVIIVAAGFWARGRQDGGAV